MNANRLTEGNLKELDEKIQIEKYNIDIPWMKQAEQFVWSVFERIREKHAFCYLCRNVVQTTSK